ncbi:MAG: hypothetical protein LUC22_00030 [Prevotella sp.]|nr:hypothetical protein [Prevotella sp.]
MTKRRNKTAAQQCKHYGVENIYYYMLSVYLNGNFADFRELYYELNKDARRHFIEYLFTVVDESDWRMKIILATI